MTDPTALPHAGNALFDSPFSFQGRLGRLALQAVLLSLLLMMVAILVILGVITTTVGTLPFAQGHTPAEQMTTGQIIGFGLLVFVFLMMWITTILYAVNFHVRRLHDLNHSGWWLLLIIPTSLVSYIIHQYPGPIARALHIGMGLLTLGLLLYLLYAPGSPDNNRYGAPHIPSPRQKIMGWLLGVPMAIFYGVAWVDYFSMHYPYQPSRYHASSRTAPVADQVDYSAPSPYTPQRLWMDLLNVAALPSNALDQTHVEQALGLHLITQTQTDGTPIHGTRAGIDWYYALRLLPVTFPDKRVNMLIFDWQDDAGDIGTLPAGGLCIAQKDTSAGLLSQDWIMDSSTKLDQQNLEVHYVKGRSETLTLVFDVASQCLKQLTLMAAQPDIPAKSLPL